MKLTVNITQELIDESPFFTKCNCPIAQAVIAESVHHGARILQNNKPDADASIDHEKGRLFIRSFEDEKRADQVERWQFKLPQEATDFIRRRDEGEAVEPFSFKAEAIIDQTKPWTGTKKQWEFDPNANREF